MCKNRGVSTGSGRAQPHIYKSTLRTKTKLDVKIACVSSDQLLSCNFSHIGHMEQHGFPSENFQRGI